MSPAIILEKYLPIVYIPLCACDFHFTICIAIVWLYVLRVWFSDYHVWDLFLFFMCKVTFFFPLGFSFPEVIGICTWRFPSSSSLGFWGRVGVDLGGRAHWGRNGTLEIHSWKCSFGFQTWSGRMGVWGVVGTGGWQQALPYLHSFTHCFSHSFNKYWLSTSYMPGKVLRAGHAPSYLISTTLKRR